jgi:FixJ family two-component response regulator
MSEHVPINVAVVDDDPSLCRAVKRLLSAAGIDCATFLSAEAFLASEDLEAPDCLLLDVQLGGMSGFDLHRKLTAAGRPLPIIYVTAHDEPEARQQAEQAGCFAFLRKTDPAEAILAAIRRATAEIPQMQSQ